MLSLYAVKPKILLLTSSKTCRAKPKSLASWIRHEPDYVSTTIEKKRGKEKEKRKRRKVKGKKEREEGKKKKKEGRERKREKGEGEGREGRGENKRKTEEREKKERGKKFYFVYCNFVI